MITQPDFDKLTAMGIDLYQLKDQPTQPNYLPIDADATLNDKFFENVLKAIHLSKAEITISSSAIDLGALLWSFTQESEFTFEANRLVTPPLEQIKQSSQMKQQLWQQLCEQTL